MKQKNKWGVVIMLALILAAAVYGPAEVNAAPKAKSVTLNYSSYTIKKGRTVKLRAAVKPKKAAGKKILWKSKNKSVATVNAKGTVKGIRKGTTTITAKVKGTSLKAVCKIYVGKPVQKITVKQKSSVMEVGGRYQITATVKPKSAANQKLTYKSSKPKIASVNKKGQVTAKKEGTAKITVKASDGSKKKATVSITVKKAQSDASSFTVTFHTNGGSAIQPQTVKKGDQAVEPEAPVREGYVFAGWYTDEQLVNAYNFSYGVTQNLNLYAEWIAQDDQQANVGELTYSEPSPQNIIVNEATGSYYVNNQVLLTAKDGVSREEIEQIAKTLGGQIVGCIEITNDYQIEFQDTYTLDEMNQILGQLQAEEAVEQATLHNVDEMGYEKVPNDLRWKFTEWSADYPEGINWGVEAINAMGAWDHEEQMSQVKVGIIDSMFDTGHEDLDYKKVWNNPNPLPDVVTADAYGNRGHGTHVSGTMAASFDNVRGISGVAPNVELYGYSILGSATDDTVTDSNKSLVGEMEWKYALARLITSNCRVINVSMGLSNPNYEVSRKQGAVFGEFLQKLLTKGYDFVIVQAAGNDSTDAIKSGIFNGIVIPEVKERVIVVGAIGTNGSHKNGFFGWFGERIFDGYFYADFSNYGDRIDVTAPGVEIYSTVPYTDKYENKFEINGQELVWSGTSMATPHVSGTAAMCFSVNPSLTGAQVKNILLNASTSTVTDTNADHALDLTANPRVYKILNADAAVDLALETGGEAVAPVNPSTGMVMGSVRGYGGENQDTVALDQVGISAYRITDHAGNLSEYAASTQCDSDGNYELVLQAGEYYLSFYCEGYLPFAVGSVTVVNEQVNYLDNVILIPDSGQDLSGFVKGTVRDALDGGGVGGAAVTLRAGWDNQAGDAAVLANGQPAETITDTDGQYSFEMPAGCYTAEYQKDGYITGYANVICTSDNSQPQDAVITPVLSEEEYRIVLTWSSTPKDLDAHLTGPLSSGERFHIFHHNKTQNEGGVQVANLDLDNMSSYGPETITLHKTQDGIYKYAVHDYTNCLSADSNALSMSGAKVELYKGNARIGVYHIPINTIGTVWNVFEIQGGEVHPVNTLENIINPVNVAGMNEEQGGALLMFPEEYMGEKEYSEE